MAENSHSTNEILSSSEGDRAKEAHRHILRDIRALQWALLLTASFFIIELAAGILTNSLALLSDAGHMLSDILALAISLYAAWMSRRAPTATKSYGYYRTEVLAALFNGITLALIIGFIYYEALHRFFNPNPVNSVGVIFVGFAGLMINLAAAWLLHGHQDLNMQGAYYHVLLDAFGSIAALLSGVLIYLTGWLSFDPLLSVVIGALVLYSSWTLIRDSINILMEAVPKHVDPAIIRNSVLDCEGVEDIHDLHIWSLGSQSHALSAHIKVPPEADPVQVRCRVEDLLRTRFRLEHTTLQVEVREGCLYVHE